MKPKRPSFRKCPFPALIIVPAMMQLASAGTIDPDTFGNITVPAATNAADTIQASGGSSPAPVVTIEGGAVITGDAVIMNGIVISSAGYTINNAGSVSGVAEGIFVQIAASSTAIINNNGTISGGDDAIFFNGNGGFITNNGTISGVTGLTSDGIDGLNDVTVINNGSITGAAGVFVGDGLSLTNNLGGTVGGGANAGVDAFDTAFIDNFGSITSTGADGIIANNNADIFNSVTTDGFGDAIAGGVITGATNGIFTGTGLSLVNENLGVITGLNGIGVDAGADSEVFNDLGASIAGSLGGVSLGANGYLENDGTISGNAGDGVTLGAGGEIFNTGLIQGTTGIVTFGTSTLTNTGTIATTAIGGNAFSGGAGDDALALNAGSFIDGNVLGGGGTNSIVFTGGLTSPTSSSNNISGSVNGFSTITKNGSGVALIGTVADVGSGLTITADTISITSGGLYFNADIAGATGPQATINAGGAAVGGTGVWNANVNLLAGGISAGAIPINLDANPENAVGAVAITGDVTHSAGSFIRVDIIPGTTINDGINSDIIEQIGAGNTYSLAGANLRLSSTDTNKAFTNGTYTVIDSDEVISGNVGTIGVQFNANVVDSGPFLGTSTGVNALDTVLTNYFVTTGFENGGTNFVVNVQHDFAGLPGLSDNAAALGGALDNSISSLDPQIQDFIAALDFSNLGTVQATLESLNPGAFIDFTAGIVNSNYRLNRMMQDHLAATRSSGDMMKMSVGAEMDSKGGMAPASPMSSKKGTFWGAVSYDWQDYEGRDSSQDFDGETGAITAGFDYRVAPALVLGILLDGSQSDFDGDAASSDIDSLRVLVYGTWGRSTGLYSDFVAGYGTHDLDLDRDLGGLLGGSSRSSTDADSLQVMWTVGYAFGDATLKHGPFAGLEYQKLDVDGFTDGGVLPIEVDDYDDDSLRALIGYRVNANFGKFTPYASITYAHEFEDDGVSAQAAFAGSSFRVRGGERGSAILLTAGSGFAITDSLSLDAAYRGEISVDDEGIDSHGGTIGLNYSF